MEKLNAYIGSRIRLYRQMKRLTLSDLAGKIHKSKATLSKYENGEITLDVQTLFELAQALGIRVQQLIDYTPEEVKTPSARDSFFPQNELYLYFYDGRRGKVIRSVLQVNRDLAGNTATLYHDLEDIERTESCRNLYFGSADFYDTFTNFSFYSQSNRIEHVTLCAANPFDRSGRVLGLLTGISRYPMLPVSIKCVLSAKKPEESDAFQEELKLSAKDLKLIKRLNMFAVEQLG